MNIGRRGVDPERWEDGRLAFDFERGLAHDHEGVRDRLANYVGDEILTNVRELYGLAGEVAVAREQVYQSDRQWASVSNDWRRKHAEVEEDELELSRYYRLKSFSNKAVKYLVIAVLVGSEFIISGLIFERNFPDLAPGFGYLLAFGVTLALIIIPHYSALGLKEGLTDYHLFELRELESQGKDIPAEVHRSVEAEKHDDDVFRWGTIFVGSALALLIIPLSILRATENNGEFRWILFIFLLFFQFAISGYFFMREWLDYGHSSSTLLRIDEARDEIVRVRGNHLSNYDAALADFHDSAEELIFTITQAPRWDSYIVETYNATIRYFRHAVSIQQPEFEQFITWARVPYLGSKKDLDASSYPLDPVAEEHLLLEEEGVMGREWLMRTMGDALKLGVDDILIEVDEGEDLEPSWLLSKSVDVILATYLRRYYDMPLAYQRPDGMLYTDDEFEDVHSDLNDFPETPGSSEETPEPRSGPNPPSTEAEFKASRTREDPTPASSTEAELPPLNGSAGSVADELRSLLEGEEGKSAGI